MAKFLETHTVPPNAIESRWCLALVRIFRNFTVRASTDATVAGTLLGLEIRSVLFRLCLITYARSKETCGQEVTRLSYSIKDLLQQAPPAVYGWTAAV